MLVKNNYKTMKYIKRFNENLKEEIKIGDKFKFINPENKSQKIKFVITSLDYEKDIANVRVYYPEINDTIFMISKLNRCERI